MSKNYFLYARKSTDVEDKQVLSIEGQLNELRSLAKSEGLEIGTEFTESRTAKVPGRPIFNDMMNRIQRGEAQGMKARLPLHLHAEVVRPDSPEGLPKIPPMLRKK